MKFDPAQMAEVPWFSGAQYTPVWLHGDGIPAPLELSRVARVLAWSTSPTMDWDGSCAGLAQLNDGFFIAWASWWGPTGSGFYGDAYGGGAEVFFSQCADDVLSRIPEKDRESLEWDTFNEEHIEDVLRDAWLGERTPLLKLIEMGQDAGGFMVAPRMRMEMLIRRWRDMEQE